MAVKILDNCCSSAYLDALKNLASNSENWNMIYPMNRPFEDKFLKLEIVNNGRRGVKHPLLAGLAIGLLLQIYEAGGQDLFIPEIYACGISIKDKLTPNNMHTDEGISEKDNLVKILGLINSDWKEEWGGGFFHNGTSNYIKPTSFCIFDPSEEHTAGEIFTDKKRLAIDFTVLRDQQSLEKMNRRMGDK